MAFVSGAALPTSARQTRATCRMSAEEAPPVVSRRAALLAGLGAAVAAVAGAERASATVEYENVGFLGGSDVIDVNNANVRVYAKFPGMYPTLAGLIVTHGPYKSVDELYSIPGLSATQKATLDKYKENLCALKPTPEYELDKYNNGLYR